MRTALQSPLFSSHRLLPWTQDCVLCLAPAGEHLVCARCEADLPRAAFPCPRCASALARDASCPTCRARPFAFDAAIARFDYGFPVDRLIHRFKYGGDLAVGRWLAERLAECVPAGVRPDVLVVPPLSRTRLRERGFNQAIELARILSRRLRVRIDARLVERRRETPPQARLDRRARHANLRGAFACTRRIAGHVAIVDDVLTTGATADAIARVLKGAGAEHVSLWAVGRAPEAEAR